MSTTPDNYDDFSKYERSPQEVPATEVRTDLDYSTQLDKRSAEDLQKQIVKG